MTLNLQELLDKRQALIELTEVTHDDNLEEIEAFCTANKDDLEQILNAELTLLPTSTEDQKIWNPDGNTFTYAAVKSNTPLTSAVKSNKPKLTALLVTKGAKPGVCEPQITYKTTENEQEDCMPWSTPLHYAFEEKNFEIADLLLRHTQESEAVNYEGKTILDIITTCKDYVASLPDRVIAHILLANRNLVASDTQIEGNPLLYWAFVMDIEGAIKNTCKEFIATCLPKGNVKKTISCINQAKALDNSYHKSIFATQILRTKIDQDDLSSDYLQTLTDCGARFTSSDPSLMTQFKAIEIPLSVVISRFQNDQKLPGIIVDILSHQVMCLDLNAREALRTIPHQPTPSSMVLRTVIESLNINHTHSYYGSQSTYNLYSLFNRDPNFNTEVYKLCPADFFLTQFSGLFLQGGTMKDSLLNIVLTQRGLTTDQKKQFFEHLRTQKISLDAPAFIQIISVAELDPEIKDACVAYARESNIFADSYLTADDQNEQPYLFEFLKMHLHNLEIVKRLIQSIQPGYNLDKLRDLAGNTVLNYIADNIPDYPPNQKIAIIKLLLELGCNPDFENYLGISAASRYDTPYHQQAEIEDLLHPQVEYTPVVQQQEPEYPDLLGLS